MSNIEKMKLLMVCLGNICRSPMAEGIMRKKLEENNIQAIVDSAGTANYHVGEAPDPRAIQKAKKYQVDISRLIGRQFTVQDYDNFDRIYVMDTSNYQNVKLLARNEDDLLKVNLILNEIYPEQNMSVPDPYYGGDSGFENVYRLLDEACSVICKNIIEGKYQSI